MRLKILTLNTLFNKALTNLNALTDKYQPDIIFLQEVETDGNNLKNINNHTYKLADYSNSFIQFGKIYGLATYYNINTLSFVSSESFGLSRSIPEIMLTLLRLGRSERSILKTKFIYKKSGVNVSAYNVHCSTWSTNGIRNKQIQTMLDDLDTKSADPIVIAGDFNYPYGRKQFEKLIERYDLSEATNNIFFTYEFKLLGLITCKWKNDYVLYKNIMSVATEKIKTKLTDHYPLISVFEF